MAVTDVDGRVIFLRKVVPGAASRSYGIHVARLAGLPEAVLTRAREILGNLEAQELDEAGHPALAAGGGPARAARRARRAQLGLFGGAPSAPEAPPEAAAPVAAHQALAEQVRGLDLARTTPLEALLFLAAAQKQLK
ncbi:MAG: hypothetical protein NVS4B10_23670 [Myxococcales bacterium]